MFQKIDIQSVSGFRLGNADDKRAATGCTVIISDGGAAAGVDVRGGGPATRETDLLRSENTVELINAVVLSGGSAYGLEAACGVMDELEKKGAGFRVGDIVVPIVCGASLFDLAVGSCDVRPDKIMGIRACENAYRDKFMTGNCGAGIGCSVGKYYGMERAMKSGLGSFACTNGNVQVGAVSAVNAFADIYDGPGNIIAGLLSEDGESILGTINPLKYNVIKKHDTRANSADYHSPGDELNDNMGYDKTFNTTLSCLITNAGLTKPQCNKLASILHDGYARAIKPVHSSLDGDTVFVMASGEVDVNFDAFAALATDILQYSIIDAASSAEDAYGLRSASYFKR